MTRSSDDSPYRAHTPGHAKPAARPVEKAAAHRPAARSPAKGRPRKRGGKKATSGQSAKPRSKAPARSHHQLSSHPTSRGAQTDTRAWLLKHYGPHCAYCGVKFSPRVMTLDHVAPRRGQTAFDRRDNLVLACRPCNALKRDMSPLAFLLAVKSRAANLLKYGAHLSAGLLDLARPLVREPEPSPAADPPARIRWNASADGGPSPYKS